MGSAKTQSPHSRIQTTPSPPATPHGGSWTQRTLDSVGAPRTRLAQRSLAPAQNPASAAPAQDSPSAASASAAQRQRRIRQRRILCWPRQRSPAPAQVTPAQNSVLVAPAQPSARLAQRTAQPSARSAQRQRNPSAGLPAQPSAAAQTSASAAQRSRSQRQRRILCWPCQRRILCC